MQFLERVEGWATTRNVTLAVLLLVAGSLLWFQLGPMAQLGSDGILDDDWGFTQDEAQAHLDGLGDDGRATYRSFLLMDYLYPVIYVPGLVLLLASATRRWQPLHRFRVVLLLPVAAGLLDWVENALLLRLLAQYPDLQAGSVAAASAVSITKLTVVTASFALAFLALVAHVLAGIWNPVKRGGAAKRR